MLLALSSDQELFSETTAKLLDELVPVGELRRLRDDPVGFDVDYWRRGAELGWTSLLVSEEHGGGSIGGHGLVDLCLVAYEFGRHAAPGPLAVTNVVAGDPQRDRTTAVDEVARRPAGGDVHRHLVPAASRCPGDRLGERHPGDPGRRATRWCSTASSGRSSRRPGRPPARHRPHREPG